MRRWRQRSQYYRERLLLVLLFSTPEIVELGSAVSLALFGLWMFATGDLFARFPKFFRSMSTLAPEWAWASFLLGAGIVQAAAVASGHKPSIRNAALLACGLWLFIAVMFWVGDWRAPSIALLVAGVIANGWIYLRTSRWWMADGEA